MFFFLPFFLFLSFFFFRLLRLDGGGTDGHYQQ